MHHRLSKFPVTPPPSRPSAPCTLPPDSRCPLQRLVSAKPTGLPVAPTPHNSAAASHPPLPAPPASAPPALQTTRAGTAHLQTPLQSDSIQPTPARALRSSAAAVPRSAVLVQLPLLPATPRGGPSFVRFDPPRTDPCRIPNWSLVRPPSPKSKATSQTSRSRCERPNALKSTPVTRAAIWSRSATQTTPGKADCGQDLAPDSAPRPASRKADPDARKHRARPLSHAEAVRQKLDCRTSRCAAQVCSQKNRSGLQSPLAFDLLSAIRR